MNCHRAGVKLPLVAVSVLGWSEVEAGCPPMRGRGPFGTQPHPCPHELRIGRCNIAGLLPAILPPCGQVNEDGYESCEYQAYNQMKNQYADEYYGYHQCFENGKIPIIATFLICVAGSGGSGAMGCSLIALGELAALETLCNLDYDDRIDSAFSYYADDALSCYVNNIN